MCEELFFMLDKVIRKERLYADANLMREKVMRRFKIGRHRLNHLLSTYADGQSFPQYINTIRMEEATGLLKERLDMSITEVARYVGLTPANLRELFKQQYGMTPTRYRKQLS